MLFNSINFIYFFVIVTTLYYALPHKWRWLALLIASCIFYMYFIPVYILILFVTIIIDYCAGILIEKYNYQKKLILIISIISNIGILIFFKYTNFFIDSVNDLAQIIGWNYSLPLLSIILPIGLSFHTFQALSYTIEVYRGNQKAEKHLGIYALYVMYYPQLVAGPIERPQNLLHQFHEKHFFVTERVFSGLKQILWGFFKKMVIADNIAQMINPVFENPHQYESISILIAAVFFSFQIFCDFSGYSDIALGTSHVMGIELMRNFRSPYFSSSISEFWSRWHISLSTWFKDYVYIPLGGNKVSKYKWLRNLFIVFLLSGFWHGASWCFILWGALHGVYLIVEIITAKVRFNIANSIGLIRLPRIYKFIQIFTVFSLVTIAWVFFRATKFDEALFIIHKMFVAIPEYFSNLSNPNYLWLEPLIFNQNVYNAWLVFLIIILSILLMEWAHKIELTGSMSSFLAKKRIGVRWSFYAALIYLILFFGVFHSKQEFIYFQF